MSTGRRSIPSSRSHPSFTTATHGYSLGSHSSTSDGEAQGRGKEATTGTRTKRQAGLSTEQYLPSGVRNNEIEQVCENINEKLLVNAMTLDVSSRSRDHSVLKHENQASFNSAELQKHERLGQGSQANERTMIRGRTSKSPMITPWRKCALCSIAMRTQTDFLKHLRDKHCAKEGGSFVCRYGLHGVCPTLPVDGVSDIDYEYHVAKDHMMDEGKILRSQLSTWVLERVTWATKHV